MREVKLTASHNPRLRFCPLMDSMCVISLVVFRRNIIFVHRNGRIRVSIKYNNKTCTNIEQIFICETNTIQ